MVQFRPDERAKSCDVAPSRGRALLPPNAARVIRHPSCLDARPPPSLRSSTRRSAPRWTPAWLLAVSVRSSSASSRTMTRPPS
eukprot:1965503-Prymnesium_polylepis.1